MICEIGKGCCVCFIKGLKTLYLHIDHRLMQQVEFI